MHPPLPPSPNPIVANKMRRGFDKKKFCNS